MACMMIDVKNFQIIGRSDETVKCPLTNARYLKSNEGQLCSVCNLSEIGYECLGLNI